MSKELIRGIQRRLAAGERNIGVTPEEVRALTDAGLIQGIASFRPAELIEGEFPFCKVAIVPTEASS